MEVTTLFTFYCILSIVLTLCIFSSDRISDKIGERDEFQTMYIQHGGMMILFCLLLSPLVLIGMAVYNTHKIFMKLFFKKG